MNNENCPDGYKNGHPQTLTCPTAQHTLESSDLFAHAIFLMREKKAGNTIEVGEFYEFLWKHGVVEQFEQGVAIEGEKIQFTGKLFCYTKLIHCKSYNKNLHAKRLKVMIVAL